MLSVLGKIVFFFCRKKPLKSTGIFYVSLSRYFTGEKKLHESVTIQFYTDNNIRLTLFKIDLLLLLSFYFYFRTIIPLRSSKTQLKVIVIANVSTNNSIINIGTVMIL